MRGSLDDEIMKFMGGYTDEIRESIDKYLGIDMACVKESVSNDPINTVYVFAKCHAAYVYMLNEDMIINACIKKYPDVDSKLYDFVYMKSYEKIKKMIDNKRHFKPFAIMVCGGYEGNPQFDDMHGYLNKNGLNIGVDVFEYISSKLSKFEDKYYDDDEYRKSFQAKRRLAHKKNDKTLSFMDQLQII